MNPLHARVIAAQRQLEIGEPLDEFADVIDLALRRLAKEGRVPFEQRRDGFLVGTEKWNGYAGAAHYRTILLNRKSQIWYPESSIGEVSAFEVYCASQVQPPDDNVFDDDRGLPSNYGDDVVYGDPPASSSIGDPRRGSVFGASYGGSRQQILSEAPADLEGIRPTLYQQMRRYVRELGTIENQQAVEQRDILEKWLRKRSKKANEAESGDLVGIADAWLHAQYYRGYPRSIPGARRKVADRVRKNCTHWLEKMDDSESPITRDIAQHLRKHVKIGVVCEYQGNWRWKF